MPGFDPNAPPFTPSFLRKPGESVPSNSVGKVAGRFLPSRNRPVVILLFGCRGAGKSTQSALLEKEYGLLNISSGTIYREGKQPFVELRKILQEEFGEGKERRYNGVVLDRFIAISEFDAFYVQCVLDAVHLPVPFVIMLSVNPELGLKRAESRGDNKTGHHHWRVVEQNTQAVTANAVYAPIGSLKTIKCTEASTVENIFKEIKDAIETRISEDHTLVRLPLAARREHPGMRLIEVYETYSELVNDLHASIGNIYGRKDSAPLSTIGAYVDREFFSSNHQDPSSLVDTFHVTLKADGQRFLLLKHRKFGYIGFPSAFTHCYDLNELFKGVTMEVNGLSDNARKSIKSKKNIVCQVEFLLDTEMVIHNDQDGPRFYVFDYVYMWGLEGKKASFEQRLKVLRDYFRQMSPPLNGSIHPVLLKDYVPINKIRTLLPKWDADTCIPIDGIVFQHNNVYKFGRDKFLYKWKPIELCTVDFRIVNGVANDNFWTFDLMVSDDISNDGGFGEVLYPGALAKLPITLVEDKHLCNGMVIELSLVQSKEKEIGEGEQETPPMQTLWQFKSIRHDKPCPNKHSIVKKIVELHHLSFDELAGLCEKVPFMGSLSDP